MRKPMICVPIIGKNESEILDMANRLRELPIDMVEWRIDFYEDLTECAKLCSLAEQIRGKFAHKLLITFRTEAEGGERVSEKISYSDTLQYIIREGVCDYIDWEMERYDAEADIFEKAHKQKIKVIGSYHNFHKTPDTKNMVNRLLQMKEMGFDIAKIAVMPQKPEDVRRLLEATEIVKQTHPSYPLITMSMGELGLNSRLYGWLYGSCLTFACLGTASAPGQVDVTTVRKALSLGDKGKRHIILTGFMGTGKSTISRELRKLTGCEEIDTDQFIVDREGRQIADIFETEGEDYFRKLETDMIDELDQMQQGIVSCGGGMVLCDLNVKKLKRVGTIVLLTASPETIYERVKHDTSRPLLKDNMSIEYIKELMEKRKRAYDAAAEIVISTDDLSATEIATEILNHFKAFSTKSS